MNEYQKKIIEDCSVFRPHPTYGIYPPYHNGLYLEDRFFETYMNSEKKPENKFYIPIFWTTVYLQHIGNIQSYLDSLNPDLEYFTISQHDDAVIERLPKNTTVYSAGGNRGDVPIPLVCSEISEIYVKKDTDKDIFASFIGSLTHPIRETLTHTYNGDNDFLIKAKGWNPNVPKQEYEYFFEMTKRSKFTLCPRGYGKTSFRLYETFQLNSVPVYVSDEFWLPFTNKINWEEICVLIKTHEIGSLKEKLLSISDEKYSKMLENGKRIWSEFFQINRMCEKLLLEI
jgi:hypothetical protein